MPFDLRTRNLQSELMDDPSLDGVLHERALAGLRRINWWSRTDLAVWRAIKRLHDKNSLNRPLTVLDIASGGGDLAIRLSERAERAGVQITVAGCDVSPTAVEFALRQSHLAGRRDVRFSLCNVLEEELPAAEYDVVMCSLFLHHLTTEQAILLMKKMQSSAKSLVLIDDLQRTLMGYWLAWLGCRLLTRCQIVHADGPMSVEGAFTINEARNLADQAGLRNVAFETHWPERFIMTSQVNCSVSAAAESEAAYAENRIHGV